MKSQEDLIIDHLKTGQAITPLDALNMYGCFRLGARIFDLKERGYPIEKTMIHNNGKKYASYKLVIPKIKEDLF